MNNNKARQSLLGIAIMLMTLGLSACGGAGNSETDAGLVETVTDTTSDANGASTGDGNTTDNQNSGGSSAAVTLSGIVQPDPSDASVVDQYADAKVYVIGQEDQATTTDQNGNFQLAVNPQLSALAAAAPGIRGVRSVATTQMFGLVVLSEGQSHGRKVDVQITAGQATNAGTVYINTVGSISGTALLGDPDATDHSGIKVYIPGTSFFDFTDVDGNYTIENVPSGTYDILRAEKPGVTEFAITSQVTVNAATETQPLAMTLDSVPVLHAISVSASPAAGGSITGGGTYVSGSSVTLTATANPGYAFVDWTEGAVAVSPTFTATAGRTLVANFADVAPPTVLSTTPADGATGVAVDSVITATFSEAMDASTINTTTFTLSDETSNLPGTVTYTGTTATFTPSSALAAGTVYTATIKDATDLAGNALTVPKIWTFTTP